MRHPPELTALGLMSQKPVVATASGESAVQRYIVKKTAQGVQGEQYSAHVHRRRAFSQKDVENRTSI
jgi:hypothetical protein